MDELHTEGSVKNIQEITPRGPSLPSLLQRNKIIGPVLPAKEYPHLDTHTGGPERPERPPNLEHRDSVVGPQLPPHLQNLQADEEKQHVPIASLPPQHLPDKIEAKSNIVGPQLPPHLQKLQANDETDVEPIGPTLPQCLLEKTEAHSKTVGPKLPPHLQNMQAEEEKQNISIASHPQHLLDKIEAESKIVGPRLPPHLQNLQADEEKQNVPIASHPQHLLDKIEADSKIVGPRLPPHLQNLQADEEKQNVPIAYYPQHLLDKIEAESKIVGPQLPPHLQNLKADEEKQYGSIGPTIPQHLRDKTEVQPNIFGPQVPDHLKQKMMETKEEEEEEEEDIYGPVPLGAVRTRGHVELEERAIQMKIDRLNATGEKEIIREEWMLELPSAKAAHFGLGPRQFRAKAAPDLSDRSCWTDTPEDRAKKRKNKTVQPENVKEDTELIEDKKRDLEQEAIVKRHKRSKESLVEMHMKKVEKEQPGPSERRPFSREVDLQVNRFDEAQKKAVLKKAQLLDTRFSTGQSKFL